MLKDYMPSNEAISSQGKSKLFIGISGVVSAMRKNIESNSSLMENKKFLSKLIFKELGMQVTFDIRMAGHVNAWVMLPELTGNNPLLIDARKSIVKPSRSKKLLKKHGGVLSGTVDRVNSKLGGVYSELTHSVHVTKEFFTDKTKDNYTYSDEMIAGVIIHELGHVFSYYEEIGGLATTNYFLKTVAEGFDRNSSVLERHVILDNIEKLGDVKFDSKEDLVKETNVETTLAIVLTKILEKNRSDMGNVDNDVTSFELRADQFATRHGAGADLAKALFLMDYNDRTLDMALLRVRLFITLIFVGPLGVVLALLIKTIVEAFFKLITNNIDVFNLYDKIKDRLKRIRIDLIAQLREGSLSKKEQKSLIESIDEMESLVEKAKNDTNMSDRLAYLLSFSIRKKSNQLELQQKLESLSNNDLYVESVRQSLYA